MTKGMSNCVRVEEYGEYTTYFMELATVEEIAKWEEESNVKMPKDSKEFRYD